MNNPCCCGACTFIQEDFSSSLDTTDVWEIIAGDAATAGGLASLDPNSTVLLRSASSNGTGYVYAEIYFGASGDEADIYFSYADANNHWRLRLIYLADADTFGTVSLFKMDGGVETEIGPVHGCRSENDGPFDDQPIDYATVTICWKGQGQRLRVETSIGTGSALFDWVNHVSGGNRAGMGSGAVGTSIEFDQFNFATSATGEAGTDCGCGNTLSTCETCMDANFSGDWLLEDISGNHPGSSSTLSWSYQMASIDDRINGSFAGSSYWQGYGIVPGEAGSPHYALINYCNSSFPGEAVLTIAGSCGFGPHIDSQTPSDCADPLPTFTVTNFACGTLGDFDVTPL